MVPVLLIRDAAISDNLLRHGVDSQGGQKNGLLDDADAQWERCDAWELNSIFTVCSDPKERYV